MLFNAIASVALLASTVVATAQPQPYRPFKASIVGLSLARRDTPGYPPEQSVCSGSGNSCSAVCGAGYDTCESDDSSTHCFSPAKKQSCCKDGTGNSCDAGYYCTHDTKQNTWCCPEGLSLTECAKLQGVQGGLETDAAAATSAAPKKTSAPKKVSAPQKDIIAKPKTTAAPVTTSAAPATTSAPVATSSSVAVVETTTTPVVVETKAAKTTPVGPLGNSTVPVATGAYTPVAATPSAGAGAAGTASAHSPSTGGAATTGISALLLAAAGVIALL